MTPSEPKSDLTERINDYIDLLEIKNTLMDVDNFGIFQLSLKRAAELMSLSAFSSGDLEIDYDVQDFIDIHDEDLLIALSPFTNDYIEVLKNSIDLGRLSPSRTRRDLDETIDEDQTFIEFNALETWLTERSFHPGEIFQEHFDSELDISSKILDEVIWLRSKPYRESGQNANYKNTLQAPTDDSNLDEYKSAYKALQIENERLKVKLASANSSVQPKAESPASPRHRKTLLILIAALCKEAKMDSQARGAAQRIERLTEQLGARVDDETIRRILSDIPEAVDSRLA